MWLQSNFIAFLITLHLFGPAWTNSPREKIEQGNEQHDYYIRSNSTLGSCFGIRGTRFRVIRYDIDKLQGPTLKFPNRIEQVEFNRIPLDFESTVSLPWARSSFVDIFLCKHNRPILIKASGLYGHTFYSPDLRTGRWDNYTINGLEEYLVRDGNAVPCYSKSNDKALYKECSDISKKLCKNHESKKELPQGRPPLGVKLKRIEIRNSPIQSNLRRPRYKVVILPGETSQRNVFATSYNYATGSYVLRPPFYYGVIMDDHTSFANFSIDSGDMITLIHPNKLRSVRFNDTVLEFDDVVELPHKLISLFTVFTCAHGNPVLIRLFGLSGYAFYILNPIIGKWTIYKPPLLTNYISVDTDWFASYKIDKVEDFQTIYDLVLYEFAMLSKLFCKRDKCRGNVVTGEPFLEVEVKVSSR